jgi:hypothetical protein
VVTPSGCAVANSHSSPELPHFSFLPLTLCLMLLASSTSKQDVQVESLARLLEAEHCGGATWPGKTKLGRAVHNSSALVAAFVRSTELCHLTEGDHLRGADGAEP